MSNRQSLLAPRLVTPMGISLHARRRSERHAHEKALRQIERYMVVFESHRDSIVKIPGLKNCVGITGYLIAGMEDRLSSFDLEFLALRRRLLLKINVNLWAFDGHVRALRTRHDNYTSGIDVHSRR